MAISFPILIYFQWSFDAMKYNFSSCRTLLGRIRINFVHTVFLIVYLVTQIAVSMLDIWLQVKIKCFSPPCCRVLWFLLKKGWIRIGDRGVRGGGCCDAWPMMHNYCPAVRGKHRPQFSTPVATIYFIGFAIQLAETTHSRSAVFRQPAKPKVTSKPLGTEFTSFWLRVPSRVPPL